MNLVAHFAFLLLSTSPLYSPLRRRRGPKIEDAVERGEIPRPAKLGLGGEAITRNVALEAVLGIMPRPSFYTLCRLC